MIQSRTRTRGSRGWFLLCSLLLLGACSGSNFVYNQLDFILPWYVDDYAELNTQQDAYLDERLAPFLDWHRMQELPAYIKIIDEIEVRLDKPLSSEDIAGIFSEFEAAWLRVEGKALDWLLDLGGQLSDEQIAGFIEVLWEKQEEYEEEYLDRTDEEFHEESYDNFVDNAEDFLGRLSDEQRAELLVSSSMLLRSDRVWLQERTDWLKKLEVLLERKPGWQQAIKDAVAQQRENLAPEYVQIYEYNMGLLFEATAKLLNSRSERQDEHLHDRLSDIREDLEKLVEQGLECPGMKGC